MKVLIDIPYEAYYTFKCDLGKGNLNALAEIVANGTPFSTEGDLISRSVLKEVIKSNHYLLSAKNNSTDYGMFTTGIMQAIDNIPSITPEKALMNKLKGDEEGSQDEWIDYDNTFYKCPDCGYLLEKCCPQCQNKVILPKGGAE